MRLLFFFALLLTSNGFAMSSCPALSGSYSCDGAVLNITNINVDSQTYDNGQKQSIKVVRRMVTGGLHLEGTDHYLPDEPTTNHQTGGTNDGPWNETDYCGGTSLHKDIVTWWYYSGTKDLRKWYNNIALQKNADGSIALNYDQKIVDSDGSIYHPPVSTSLCKKD